MLNSRLIILIGIATLYSCSVSKHVELSEKHRQKAIAKGAIYTKDSVLVTITDTVINNVGDTLFVPREVKIPCPDIELPKTKTEARQEGKTERVKIRQEGKTDRNNKDEETKQAKQEDKHEERQTKIENKCSMFWTVVGKLTWLWFLISLILGIIVGRKTKL